MEELISVALCTYNGARFIRGQLDSLLAQTHRNIEVLAADDASTDDTVSILQEYAERDPRVRVLVNRHNMGFKKNFEQVISSCRGSFIAPCDQDDIWFPEKLR
jgi:glycosyltransferase involved in cell wall biosynthesis